MELSIDECFAFVKDARSRHLTREERLDILRLHAWFRSQGAAAVSPTVAEALGRNLGVVKDVWREYLMSRTVRDTQPASNKTTHNTVVPRSKHVVGLVQSFVRDRRATTTLTTAVDVLMYLKEIFVLEFDADNKKQFNASLRGVQRFLKHQGYRCGKRKTSTYHLSAKNVLARDSYVQLMQPHVASPTRPHVVYTDESYIHHHYKCRNQDLYDPSDTLDTPAKEKHKGRRYCFIAGILDSATLDSKVLALDIFTGGTTASKAPKDYHAMFNHTYYVDWFAKLLDELNRCGATNTLIIMDNAKYHKGRPADTPSGGQRKEKLLAACATYGIDADVSELKSVIWGKLATHVALHVQPVVVKMAKSRGHTVVYTPPHHSNLQPIETVWAIVKGAVGRQYTDMTKFPEVKTRLVHAFDSLTSHAIKGCVRKAEGCLQKLYEHIVQVDNLGSDEEASEDSESSAGDSDNE
ncbi:hypothetical protein B5M09_005203 [Aphanomyces astaci]|uniref:Tc1-like transposase DDE domain-containing protein n=1 Tax=Aphanomyces astaci TaxID=112090 RepID=A0A3R7WMZ8_APHAT|nr:hypothetical protein B5M09_005203 [Aphanomyces astaci]